MSRFTGCPPIGKLTLINLKLTKYTKVFLYGFLVSSACDSHLVQDAHISQVNQLKLF